MGALLRPFLYKVDTNDQVRIEQHTAKHMKKTTNKQEKEKRLNINSINHLRMPNFTYSQKKNPVFML